MRFQTKVDSCLRSYMIQSFILFILLIHVKLFPRTVVVRADDESCFLVLMPAG